MSGLGSGTGRTPCDYAVVVNEESGFINTKLEFENREEFALDPYDVTRSKYSG